MTSIKISNLYPFYLDERRLLSRVHTLPMNDKTNINIWMWRDTGPRY